MLGSSFRTVRATRPVLFSQTRSFSQAFDGSMARQYMRFFNNAEPVWKHTVDVVESAVGSNAPATIVDVASGPGEPGCSLAAAYPDSRVLITDGAEAMLTLADDRISTLGLSDRVSSTVMDLNDFGVVPDEMKGSTDLVTAQFALMFTPDLAGSLGEISATLRPGGWLVGTVWEEFFLLPILGETMTKVLGEPPPPPPINPLSMKDAGMVDDAMKAAGFLTDHARHNETGTISMDMGEIDDPDTFGALLIPVTPSLTKLQETRDDDVFETAREAMADAVHNQRCVFDGRLMIPTSTYRYFVCQKPE